jgi:hypothetical protein
LELKKGLKKEKRKEDIWCVEFEDIGSKRSKESGGGMKNNQNAPVLWELGVVSDNFQRLLLKLYKRETHAMREREREGVELTGGGEVEPAVEERRNRRWRSGGTSGGGSGGIWGRRWLVDFFVLLFFFYAKRMKGRDMI